MLRFRNPCFAVFTELNPNLAQLRNLPNLLAQPLSTQKCSLTLTRYYPKVGNFWSSGFQLWIFVHNCQNFMLLCMSARFEFWHTTVPLCTWIPSNAQSEKRTYAILLCQWECLDPRIQSPWWSSYQHVLSVDLYFPQLCYPWTCWNTGIFLV
jgi:hypothetical protein